MTQGTVKWFCEQRSLGFIQPDDGSPDVSVHIGAAERAAMPGLDVGEKVAFEVVTDRQSGKNAAPNLRAA
jgi:CspA family cold shock protein